MAAAPGSSPNPEASLYLYRSWDGGMCMDATPQKANSRKPLSTHTIQRRTYWPMHRSDYVAGDHRKPSKANLRDRFSDQGSENGQFTSICRILTSPAH